MSVSVPVRLWVCVYVRVRVRMPVCQFEMGESYLVLFRFRVVELRMNQVGVTIFVAYA